MHEEKLEAQIVDYNSLSSEDKKEIFFNFQHRLSEFKEAYTDIGEIMMALECDKHFYIWVLLINNKPEGHIQFKYFEDTKMIFIDYICFKKNISLANSNLLYILAEQEVIKMFDVLYIITEITFNDKKRNKALTKLFAQKGFYDLGITYLQPPTISIFPTIGKLLIKTTKYHGYDINLIIKEIYFNHYGYWYRKNKKYKYVLNFVYKIQKYFLKEYNSSNYVEKDWFHKYMLKTMLKKYPDSNNDIKQIWLEVEPEDWMSDRDTSRINTAYIDINTPDEVIKEVIESIKISNKKEHSEIIRMFRNGIMEKGYCCYKNEREIKEETYTCI